MSQKLPFTMRVPMQFGIALVAIMVLCLIASGLSQLGIGSPGIVIFFVICLFGLALLSARMNLPPSPVSSGVVASIEALSAFGLFGIVGAVYAYGHDGLAVLVGLVGGLCLSLIVVAPRFSMIASRSLPDFLCLRLTSEAVRFVMLAIMAVTTVLFLAAQIAAASLIASQGLGMASVVGVLIGVFGVLFLTSPAWQQRTSGATVLAIFATVGGLFATYWLISTKTGIILPQLGYGGLYRDVSAAEMQLGSVQSFADPTAGLGTLGTLALVACLALGAAVMPHSIMRVSTSGSPAKTEQALRVAIVFLVLLATTLPSIAVLGRAEFLKQFASGEGSLFLRDLQSSVRAIVDVCGTGSASAREVCSTNGFESGFSVNALTAKPEGVFFGIASLANAPDWMLGLLSMVGLLVVILASTGASIALASAFNSRLPKTEARRRCWLTSAGVVFVAATLVVATGVDVINLGAWTYSLVAASLFCPVVLSLWWNGMSAKGALAGMIGGFLVTATYIAGSQWGGDFASGTGDEWSWLGVPSMMAGVFGIIVSFILSLVVSAFTEKPATDRMTIFQETDKTRFIANLE